MRTAQRIGAVAIAAGLALGTAGCSGQAGTDGPVELTYWTWAPNMEQVVEIWNEANPDIQVTVNKQDGGDPAVTKLLTAIKAGSGAPDLMQVEYQKVPTLVASDALADLTEYGAGDLEDAFPAGVWNGVTLGGDAIYAVPQDTGPMMAYYLTDLLAQYGIEIPTTWDEYADAARTIHAADPSAYLGTFSSNDAGWFTGLAQQAGASWWSIDGDAWGVDIEADPTERVADFWGGLVEEGVIDNTPMYTPEWNAGLNDGSQVGWVSAVWAPGVLSGNAADTEGLWTAAPLPTWDGEEATGAWGGSSTGITTQSRYPEQAEEFLTWLNSSEEGVRALAEIANIYPAASDTASILTAPPAFFANQADFYDVAAAAAESVQPFTYGPNVNVAFSAYNDEFAKAAESRTRQAFLDAVGAMQTITVDDLTASGFTVR